MKKTLLLAAAALLFAGCTTVESTQRFNALGLGTPQEKAVCFTTVQISGLYFFGLPIVTGGNKGDGDWSMFHKQLTTNNAVFLLTKEAKSKGAARVINVQVSRDSTALGLPFFFFNTIQASGTGVRTKSAAVQQAAKQYDMEP